MQIFSPEWVQLYQEAINQNEAYAKASAKWEEGKIALSMKRESGDAVVMLDLLQGQCLGAEAVDLETATEQATFIISGDEQTWREVLSGQLQPLMGIMRGKLKLTKGSIARLLPYSIASTELVRSAQNVGGEF